MCVGVVPAIHEEQSPQADSYWDAISAPEGGLLARSGCVATVMRWDATSGRPVRSLSQGGEVMPAVFSPDRTLAASAGYDSLINPWSNTR